MGDASLAKAFVCFTRWPRGVPTRNMPNSLSPQCHEIAPLMNVSCQYSLDATGSEIGLAIYCLYLLFRSSIWDDSDGETNRTGRQLEENRARAGIYELEDKAKSVLLQRCLPKTTTSRSGLDSSSTGTTGRLHHKTHQ